MTTARAWPAALILAALGRFAGAGGPAVFWAGDPVGPGEAVVLVGEGLGHQPAVELARLPDGEPSQPVGPPAWPESARAVEALQVSEQSLKFVVPKDFEPGVYVLRVTTAGGSVAGTLNRPRAWWAQGDLGRAASPGGWVRAFGVNLAAGAAERDAVSPTIRLEGPTTLLLEAEGSSFAAKAALPADVPPGEYRLWVHNGLGGDAAWSDPITLSVSQPRAWPQAVFDVTKFGAAGDGLKDDTAAVLAALEEAAAAGGGVVYFPRGRYRLSEGLTVPRFTVVRGEARELSALCWTELPEAPEALVRGTNSFGLEELTLYAQQHCHVIAGDLGSEPEAGDVFLRRLRVRADLYRGHLKPEEVDARFREALRLSTGGGDTVRLGGRNVTITDCDFYGSGRSLFLSRVRGGRVAGNRFYNGRWGWYCISGSDGLIFEDNEVTGADLMSTGGGLNCLDGSSFSQNVYYAHNRLSLMHGWDREAMTSDAGGEVYFGKIASGKGSDPLSQGGLTPFRKGTRLTLAEEPKPTHREWIGAGVFVLAGRGAGQYRRVVGHDGTTIEIDRPWAVPPDAESDLGITMFQGHYLLVDNEFTDTGAVQFYGTSIECVVAGNRGTRTQGFRGRGLWYHGYQPSWFCRFLDNEILEGNYYHFNSAAEAMLEIYGARRPPLAGPLNVGAVVRGNHLHSGAHLRVDGACRDVVVEGNRVEKADMGVFVSEKTRGVLVRKNQFHDVRHEVLDEEALRRAAEERMRKFLGRQEPVATWSFEKLTAGRFPDDSGNGFFAKIVGGAEPADAGRRGRAVRFDGTGYLRVDEPAVFNAPNVTVSLWVKPETTAGRRGLVAKRFHGTACPLVLSQNAASLHFEATEQGGPWTFNFGTPVVLKPNEWTHVAAVVEQGKGVTLYAGGRQVARLDNPARRETNAEPLILGREAWGGDPPKGDTPGFFIGLLDEVKMWTRALSGEEIEAECARERQ